MSLETLPHDASSTSFINDFGRVAHYATPRKVAVIGAGYVGLPLAVVLASYGHDVIVAESDPTRRNILLGGKSPLLEPGLEEMLHQGIDAGNLRFTASAATASKDADVVFLCVATPLGENGSADMTYIMDATHEIAQALKPGAIVVNKSTAPIGTVRRIQHGINREDIAVVANPEFLREGHAIAESLNPDRIVVGSSSRAASEFVAELFSPSATPVIFTDATTAETIKYTANAFLATRLSFVNSIAGLCEKVEANLDDLVSGIGTDHRIGPAFLSPGPGWGGSCLPKDVATLLSIAQENEYEFPLLEEVMAANVATSERIVRKIARAAGVLSGATIAVWGLSFKAGTADRRDSPALNIVNRLLRRGATIVAFDPTVEPGEVSEDLKDIEIASSMYDAVRFADALVVLTEWPEFADADLDKVHALMSNHAIVDARNILDAKKARELHFEFSALGRY